MAAIIFLLSAAGVAVSMVAFLRHRPPTGERAGRVLTVEIVSTPAGASVFFDGRFAGSTPIRLAGVEAGTHYVRLEKAGFRPMRQRLIVGARDPGAALATSGTHRIDVPLEPVPTGRLQVASVPPGAEVHVDGQFRGFAPATVAGLSVGAHRLLLRKTNHEDYAMVAEVRDGEVTVVDGVLADRVEKFLLATIDAEPRKISHYTDTAHYYFIAGRMDRAIEYYAKGIELGHEPGASKADVTRHDKEIKKHYGWPNTDTRNFRRRMAEVYAEISRRHPGNLRLLEIQITEHLRRGNVREAVEVCRKAAHVAPTNHDIQMKLGEMYLRVREFAASAKAFTRAVELKPKEALLRLQIGRHCWEHNKRFLLGERKRVLAFGRDHLTQGLTLTEHHDTRSDLLRFRFYLGRGLATVVRQLGDRDESEQHLVGAVADLERAVATRHEPVGKARMMIDLANVYIARGRRPDARALYEKVIAMTPEDSPDVWVRRKATDALKRLK